MNRVIMYFGLVSMAITAACSDRREVSDTTGVDTTHDQDGHDVDSTPDGSGAELPVNVLFEPDTLRVLEGFATCPSLTMVYGDGTIRRVSLDPSYPLPDVDTIDEVGLVLSWESEDGLVATGDTAGCRYAAVGVRPGNALVGLRVTASDGASAVVGRVQTEVVALPDSVVVTRVSARPDGFADGMLQDAVVDPGQGSYVMGQAILGVSQVATVQVDFVLDAPSLAGVSALPVTNQIEVEVSDTRVVAHSGGKLEALAPGRVTLSAGYRVGARELGRTSSELEVSGALGVVELRFGLPRTDDGKVLPDTMRSAAQLPLGQCVNFAVYAATPHESADGPDALFFRDVTSITTLDALGSGLVVEGAPHRFCAQSNGDAAVRACLEGTCTSWGVVVRDLLSFPTLTLTLAPEVRLRAVPDTQVLCVPFQATATFPGEAARDVSTSPALHFRQPQGANGQGLAVALDTTTGLPQHEAGKLCLPLRWEHNLATEWWLGVGYGQTQSQASIMVLPPIR